MIRNLEHSDVLPNNPNNCYNSNAYPEVPERIVSMYTQPATALTPALIIYLIDISDSMNQPCDKTDKQVRKIDVVNQALRGAIKDMVRRSLRDNNVQPRYKVAIFAYNTGVIDVLSGIRTITEIVGKTPTLLASGRTNTEAGFAAVEKLLLSHLSEFQYSPAPLICHLTDALSNSDDPLPIVERIKAMKVVDGPVLVENVYVANDMLRRSVRDWHAWGGISKASQIKNEYAKVLFNMSSTIPESYRQNINNYGYHLQEGVALFFPGSHGDLVKMAFVTSAATQIK